MDHARSGRKHAPAARGLVLLFEHGSRPDRETIRAALAHHSRISISHDPAIAAHAPHVVVRKDPPEDDSDWLELLADGLTFDLLGLCPGPGIAIPEIEYLFNCEVESEASGEALGLFPGPHIAHGANALPIVRTLLGLGAALTRSLDGIRTVCWPPARSAIAPKFFARTVDAWLAGGPFPALGMLGMRFGERGALTTEGLDFFIGSEMAIEPGLCTDRTAATRLAVRVAHELVGRECLSASREFVTEAGDTLLLVPDPDAGLIRITCA
ncbi:hypothetical protein [Erythrobacter sp.]|uniref:hypothetical protein n=1 Tax=Erythrobacter sp. TaxID=1042 RepID=UPI001B0809A2|nr:hypothetical protein [Erythrobacter sp.]MBO6526810.1 hypothetical protein [Erythrobacter sp.]MBO6528483.1 hypothetical protein [Erythrobacter sp.]